MPSKWSSHLPTPVHSRPRGLSGICAGILVAIGWLSLAAPQAMGGVTLVQHTSKDAGSSSSASLAFPANNTAGHWIGVVIRAGHSSQVLTVSDTRGNTYKQAVQFNQTLDVPNGETLAIYYAENISGGSNTITVSESLANNTLRFAILEYSGLAISNSIDVTTAAQGSGTTLNSGTATTTVGGDLILGEVATASGVTFTAGSGYTIEERVPAAPNTKMIAEDAVQATAGPVSVGAALSPSENGGALLAAFKAAAGGSLPPSIASLSPPSGPVGTSVTITGTNFGALQGTSTVTFNGVAATPKSWSATSIVVPVPAGATTGNVVVPVGGIASNALSFTVTPSISSLNPASGPGGTSVTITGNGFGTAQGGSTVTFGGIVATPTSWSATSIVVPAPNNGTAGTVAVVVTVGGFASNTVNFTETPTIVSLNPTSGPVGTSVIIAGSNFGASQGVTNVTFNGVSAGTATSWSATSITVVVPSGATTGPVVVVIGGVASLSSNAVTFTATVPPPPSITSLSPASDPAGTAITITGGNFGATQGASAVTFNGVSAGTASNWSASSITVNVPSGAATGNVVVTVGGQASNGVAFTVTPSISSLTPTSGPGGISVTITGNGFGATQGASTVTFGGIAATPISWSATSIVVPVPNNGTAGTVTVFVTVGGIASNSANFTVTPIINAVNPTSAQVGAAVTISGTNFGPVQNSSTVTFSGIAATPISWSTTSIVVPVPTGAVTGNVVVTAGGQVSNSFTFIVTGPPPNISTLTPNNGPVGTSVNIAGANFGASQGTSTVTFNGVSAATASSWSASSITVSVPPGATTGSVIVTVGGQASDAITFTVTVPGPSISTLTPNNGPVGTSVTIAGSNFGASEGTSTVTFNGVSAGTASSWSASTITVNVPSGATTGNVVVTVSGQGSNALTFTVPAPAPNISSVTPSNGPVGTSIIIAGANFGTPQGTSTVTFNGLSAGTATSWSGSSITVSVPPGATTGNVVVSVGGQTSNGLSFTVTPTISSVTNNNTNIGPVGTLVTITGTNFGASQGTSTVTFNGVATTPTFWSSTSILAPVPNGATTGPVVVTVGGFASNGVTFTVIPNITGLTPSSGPVGTQVTVTGTTFGATQGSTTLTFGGVLDTPSIWSDTRLVVTPPNLGAGNWGIQVFTGNNLGSNAVSFTLTPAITSLSPTSGPLGTLVTIAGSSFGAAQGSNTVTFNGTVATPTSWSDSSIVVAVPSGATTGNVVVTANGLASNGVLFTVTAPPPPTVASLSPPLGLVGTSVTITGANFGSSQGASTVMFNGVTAVPTSWTPTSIVAPVPSGATTGSVFVTVGGVASNGSNFTVTVPPVPVALVQHTGKDAGSTSSSTLAFKSNNTAGNWIAVVARAGKSGQIFTVSDSLHNTYRTAAQFNVTVDTPNGDTLGVFYAENIAGGANTITVTDTISGNTLRFAIFEYSGVAHANSLDGVIAGQGTNAGPNSGSITTSMNGDLLLGAAMSAGPAAYTAGPGYKMEEFVPAEPNTKLVAEDQIQPVAGVASASATLVATDHWGAVLAAFRPGNAGITGPTITTLNPTFAPVGTSVTINGTNFGSSQGTSVVSFNGMAATPASWTSTSIVAPVPAGASTGTVVVAVGGVASNGVTFTVTAPPPSIASLNPSSAIAGNGAFTLTVNGTNFLPSSVIQWNGSARPTAFLSSTQLQAAITSADIAGASVAKVAVSNLGLGGAVSSPSTFFVGTSGGSNFAVLAVTQEAQDIVFDPKNQVFYLSVANNASSNPNTISVLDPAVLAITSAQQAGSNPNVLAISDDSQFLYAGVDGAASVQRFTLPGIAPDISYALGSGSFGPYFALDLQVAPGTPHTTAVTLGNTSISPEAQGGITIFDDATPRAANAGGIPSLFDSIQWGADPTALYGANYEDSANDFYTLSVNPGGVTLNQDFPRVLNTFLGRIHFDAGTNLIYGDDGHAINPSTGLPVGNFNAVGPMVVDSSLNTAFFLTTGSGVGATIRSFDLTHFTPIASVSIPGAAGTLSRLIRWGQNGLAFLCRDTNGSGRVFLIAGSFVGPAPAFVTTPPPNPTIPPTPLPNAPTIASLLPSSAIAGGTAVVLTVSGAQFDPAAVVQFNGAALATTFVSSTQLQAAIPASDMLTPATATITVANPPATGGLSSGSTFFIGASGGFSSAGTAFAVQIVNQASKNIVFDPFDQLFYLSVPNTNSSGNAIAVLDPSTTQIVGEQYAGSNPNVISISDDGQFLYIGLDGSSSVQRFTLPSLAPDIRYSLGANRFDGPYFALYLQVAPGAPRTTAVTSGIFNLSPAAASGISIFDDAAMRPTIAAGVGSGGSALYDSLQWGSDATTLYAVNDESTAFDFYALSVNSTGVTLTSDYPNGLPGFRDRIHFDAGTKLIYSDTGYVVNPATGAPVGTFLLTGLVPPFTMVADSNLNAGFFAARTTNSSLAIYAFNLSTFAPLSSILIPNVTGNPLRLIRWGQNGLAFNTDAGEIVLVGGNFVH